MHSPSYYANGGIQKQPSAFAVSSFMERVRANNTPEPDQEVLADGIHRRFNAGMNLTESLVIGADQAKSAGMPGEAELVAFGGVNTKLPIPWWNTTTDRPNRDNIQVIGESTNNPAAAYNTPSLDEHEYKGVFDDTLWDGADPDVIPFDTARMRTERDKTPADYTGQAKRPDMTMVATPNDIGKNGKAQDFMIFNGTNKGFGTYRTPPNYDAMYAFLGVMESFNGTAFSGMAMDTFNSVDPNATWPKGIPQSGNINLRERLSWVNYAITRSRELGLNPVYVLCTFTQESGWDNQAKGDYVKPERGWDDRDTHCLGLGQLRPSTAWGQGWHWSNTSELFDAKKNIYYSTQYMRQMFDMAKKRRPGATVDQQQLLACSAYFWGPGNVFDKGRYDSVYNNDVFKWADKWKAWLVKYGVQ